jgi:superfamily II DNA or RNA helicase
MNYEWQQKALINWEKNKYKGIIKAATGSGKTFIGINAIRKLLYPKTIVCVPTLVLQEQWKQELIKAGCDKNNIGLIGNGNMQTNKKYIVAIINSLRNILLECELLIIDEIHHSFSEKNKKVFSINYDKFLGLSATPERADESHEEFIKDIPIIYEYSLQDGINNQIISDYELINVPVSIQEELNVKYKELSNIITEGMNMYGSMNHLLNAVKKYDRTAIKTLKAIQERKKLLLTNPDKYLKTIELIKQHKQQKIIVFCEFIESAEIILSMLEKSIDFPVFVYHSKLKKEERIKILNEYKENSNGVLITVRCLDEGMNIPEVEIGIIVGGSSVKRQMIQRLGRILRKINKEKKTILYQLYTAGTKEYQWIKNRSKNL